MEQDELTETKRITQTTATHTREDHWTKVKHIRAGADDHKGWKTGQRWEIKLETHREHHFKVKQETENSG